LKHIKAAGGVVFKGPPEELFVILIYRRGVWDLPKGKKERGESVRECAQREVKEELGCLNPSIQEKLTTTIHEYTRNGTQFSKETSWFAMTTETESDFNPDTNEGIEQVSWFPLGQATQKVGYENLVKVLSAFKKWYGTGQNK